MSIDIKKLKTKNWQHKIGTIGDVVTDLDDIAQCYYNIINICKGQIPLAPNLGCDIIDAIGEDPETARQITETILLKEFQMQEPRGKITAVKCDFEDEKLIVKLHFKSVLTNAERTETYYVNR